ncbi:MAG TPA: hypothetical protein VM010_06945 [Chitinophagaceae bacterium]|nr:hypothetical protein [Chitinophagaceae bacterium]
MIYRFLNHCFLLVVFYTGTVTAQYTTPPVALAHYVFDSFRKGTVLQKNKTTMGQVLNYNVLTGEMIFESGGTYLAIAEPQGVDTVYIESRRFVSVGAKFYEVLTTGAAPLFVEYKGTVQEPGASIGYGNASNTTAASSVKSLISSGGAYALQLPDHFQVIPHHNYWIYKNGTYQKANNAQQLAKIFPDQKTKINALVNENKTNFSKVAEVKALVQQLQQ